jgi:hypothetical protein
LAPAPGQSPPVTDDHGAETLASRDDRYFEILARHLRVCSNYKPKFGTSKADGLTKAEFETRYGDDPFYRWVGMNSPLMYAAHKAAGGITSMYRQLGKGGERLFQRVLQDELGLSVEQSAWTYEIPGAVGKTRKLELDGRIDLSHVEDSAKKARVETWLDDVATKLKLEADYRSAAKGVVFEVRQGYKSADSKRQNADVANAASAYAHHYIPSLVLLSTQINETVALRYGLAQWLLLLGTEEGSSTESTWTFMREVVGYDLAAFFERKTDDFRGLIESIAESLLEPA